MPEPAEAGTTRPWSCDTFVAQRDATTEGRVIFGKNSDRPAGEAQPLRFMPATTPETPTRLAYLSIPSEPSYAHLGSAPFWCWGYEFGINEHGVAIGNEAQFTRSWAENVYEARNGNPLAPGLIGMELVRLGLERGASALEALEVITGLLEQHGQWASGLFGKTPAEGSYDNSYLITDRTQAWVLETSGKEWIARRIDSGTYSISNEPTIRCDYDLRSSGLLDTARSRGWIAPETDLDYAASHADPGTPLAASHMRRQRSHHLLEEANQNGGVNLETAKAVLRDHYEGTFLDGPYFNASRPDFLTLCMHEHPSGFTWGNTAASTIVELGTDPDDLTVVWWTPLPPCIGAYLPIFLEAPELPHTLQLPAPHTDILPPEKHTQSAFDPKAFWWRAQNLLDAAKGDVLGSQFTNRQSVIRQRFDLLECGWARSVTSLRDAWRRGGNDERTRLAEELRGATEAAVADVDREVHSLLSGFGVQDLRNALEPRWR